eukprot:7424179-Ditylum_brightwellii.AAC.1
MSLVGGGGLAVIMTAAAANDGGNSGKCVFFTIVTNLTSPLHPFLPSSLLLTFIVCCLRGEEGG